MKKSIQNRIRKGLFPEMPQSFADRLTGALKIGGAFNADQRSAEEAPTAPVLPERSKRRFPFGKIFNGVAAAVLAALCIVIAVFGIILPNVQKTHGATHPDGYRADFPVGKWTLAEVGQNGEAVDPGEIGLWMELAFSDDGSVTVKTVTGGAEGQYVYRYTFADNAIELTAEGGEIPVLPASGTYDPETDTLRFANEDGARAIFRRKAAASLQASMLGVWSHSYTKYEGIGLTIKKNGAFLTYYTCVSETDTPLIYTVENNVITFTGDGISFTAVYLADEDALSVTWNDKTLQFERSPSLESPWGTWTMTEMILKDGTRFSADEIGSESTLYFAYLGPLTYTWNVNGNVSQTEYEFWIKGNSIPLRLADGTDVNDPEITYDLETDTLRLFTANDGRTYVYVRMPDLAGKWTLTGIEYNGSVGSPELFGMQMWLEINANGTAVMTMSMGDDMDVARFLYEISGAEIVLNEVKDTDPMMIRLTYDAETDTLHMDYSQYGYEGNSSLIFSRTPDAVIPVPEQEEIASLRRDYPEYFGLDTSKGLKVYVWQMSNDGYFCALLKGSDNKTEAEIGGMKGTTIEQMRLILSTYGLEEKEIEVVPFHNPISSYWYEIDNDYKVWIRRLVKENMPFTNEELEGLKSPPFSIADVVYDVDGDGQLETCSLNRGPTSSDITVVFTVYRNGTLAYRNTFDMDEGEMTFSRSNDGLRIKRVWNDGIQIHTEYSITIENGMIVLADEIRGGTVEYWGLDDPKWNMAVVKTPEERLEGLWCAMHTEEGQDGLKEIRFYQDEKRGVRCASFYESGILYDGYTYTLEEQESDRQDCSKSYLFTFANENGHERKLILYIRDHNEDEIDEDRTPWKDDSEQHTFDTFLKLTPITAEELPMKQDKYIFAGEGRVHYLDLIDLNGDGKPVRVSVYGYTPVSVVTGEEGESELTVQIGACEWKINEKLVMDSGIYIDLDPNDGHGNLLLSTTRADGTERTYELHLEKNAEAFGDRRDSFTLVCGHIVEGYCFLNDSEQQELMLGAPTDLLGAKYGYREVKGEALEPVDEWLQASALIERVMFGKREDNIKDGTLLHLVRALPCEIDGEPATLEPGVYLHLWEWHESMDRIVFLTEDERWITVYLDGTAPYTVGGVPLADYFDNAPKG